jgi:hypothetical protein
MPLPQARIICGSADGSVQNVIIIGRYNGYAKMAEGHLNVGGAPLEFIEHFYAPKFMLLYTYAFGTRIWLGTRLQHRPCIPEFVFC